MNDLGIIYDTYCKISRNYQAWRNPRAMMMNIRSVNWPDDLLKRIANELCPMLLKPEEYHLAKRLYITLNRERIRRIYDTR